MSSFVVVKAYNPRVPQDPFGRSLLKVAVGDHVCVIGPDDRGWSKGYLRGSTPAQSGLFPSQCIARSSTDAAPSAVRPHSTPLSTAAPTSNNIYGPSPVKQQQQQQQQQQQRSQTGDIYTKPVAKADLKRRAPVKAQLDIYASAQLRSRVTSPNLAAPVGGSSDPIMYQPQSAPRELISRQQKLRGSSDDSDVDYRRQEKPPEKAARPTRPPPVVVTPAPAPAVAAPPAATAAPAPVAALRQRALGRSRDDSDIDVKKPARAAPVAAPLAPLPESKPTLQLPAAPVPLPPAPAPMPNKAPRAHRPLGQSRDDFNLGMRQQQQQAVPQEALNRKLPCPPVVPVGAATEPNTPQRPAPMPAPSPQKLPPPPSVAQRLAEPAMQKIPSPQQLFQAQQHAPPQAQAQQQQQQQPTPQQLQQLQHLAQQQQQYVQAQHWQQMNQQRQLLQHQQQQWQAQQQQMLHMQQQEQQRQQAQFVASPRVHQHPPSPRMEQQVAYTPPRRKLEQSRDDSDVRYHAGLRAQEEPPSRAGVFLRAIMRYVPQSSGDLGLEAGDTVLLVSGGVVGFASPLFFLTGLSTSRCIARRPTGIWAAICEAAKWAFSPLALSRC
jgi:hypothetical protein